MKKSRFTEEQMVFALKQAELETSVPEVCGKQAFPMPCSIHGARNRAGFLLRS